jgi:competence protein ComGC
MRRKHPLTVLEAVLILLVVFVWMFLLIQSVTREERLTRGYMLDGKGVPVEVYYREGRR